jgi:hypothetical protein
MFQIPFWYNLRPFLTEEKMYYSDAVHRFCWTPSFSVRGVINEQTNGCVREKEMEWRVCVCVCV